MISPLISFILSSPFISLTTAFSLAHPVKQHLVLRGSPYNGGWPLGLSTSAGDTCPVDSVSCSTKQVNPNCCPVGNSCIWGPIQYQNYCCPTSVDCNEAVVNYPRCAYDNQTMFANSPAGYFCCNPGEIGVNPSTGTVGGLCEPANQVVPTSLLATIVAQIGLATVTPTAASPSNHNASTTGSGSSPAETNPSSAPTSTTGYEPVASGANAIGKWPTALKVGVIVAILAVLFLLCIAGSILRRRRQRLLVVPGSYSYGNQAAEYDEYANRVGVYPPSAAYESYRNSVSPANNVTVNVVHGGDKPC